MLTDFPSFQLSITTIVCCAVAALLPNLPRSASGSARSLLAIQQENVARILFFSCDLRIGSGLAYSFWYWNCNEVLLDIISNRKNNFDKTGLYPTEFAPISSHFSLFFFLFVREKCISYFFYQVYLWLDIILKKIQAFVQ